MTKRFRILALEPYLGGSHQAFLNGWSEHSRHTWTILGLPPYKWKWRMRHAAITFPASVAQKQAQGQSWDLIFCSDMLDLASFKALAPAPVNQLPSIIYFHENQLTYPLSRHDRRDYHFGLTNMTSALAADQVWFNSTFHKETFLCALEKMLKKMPDHQPWDVVSRIEQKSSVKPQGVTRTDLVDLRPKGPMNLLWAARWEYDKDPETFFCALEVLQKRSVDFKINVIGERFRECPNIFQEARIRFSHRIDAWGYQETRTHYQQVLSQSHIIVSTAIHEFFGIGIVEAALAGVYPLLPKRLSYPEIFDSEKHPHYFYDGSAQNLADRLEELSRALAHGKLWPNGADEGARDLLKYRWDKLAPELDVAVCMTNL